jgi:hypothetical protein
MFTLGTAAKHVGKSKPTISKAIKDGKLSATKVNGIFQIEPSELLRVFPNRPSQADSASHSASSRSHDLDLAKQHNEHLTASLEDMKERLEDMKSERDLAMRDAREDRARVMSLLEDQRPKSIWTRLFR